MRAHPPDGTFLYRNDDKTARVLEKLFDAGLTSLFVEIALEAAEREGVGTNWLDLDATSFSVHRRYAPGEWPSKVELPRSNGQFFAKPR
jgi:hypothetical protein